MTSRAVHVGQARGRAPRRPAGAGPRAASAAAPSAATLDLVAARAQVDRQRAAQARLVVDDQHAAHAGSPDRRSGSGGARIVRPPPGVWSATIAPPIASMNPRATASPRPTPPPPLVAEPLERLEEPLALLGGDAGAVVDDLELRALGAGERAHLHGCAARAVAQRVVDQVGEHPLEQAGVGRDQRQVLGHVES